MFVGLVLAYILSLAGYQCHEATVPIPGTTYQQVGYYCAIPSGQPVRARRR